MDKFRVKGKKLSGKYIEIRLKPIQSFYHAEVLCSEFAEWMPLNYKNGKRSMFRNRVDMLSQLCNTGWHFETYVQRYKNNNATFLLKKKDY